MTHEPEVAAAVYLAGTLDAAERERFEEHLLGCEECWSEVRTAHRGRALAESLREVAPQPLRERVRASVAAASRSDRRRRRRPLVAVELAQEPAADVDVEAAAIGRVERAQIERALWALTEDQRIAIALMDIVGFTAAEVAGITGSPRGTVLARVHRGRKALARLVAKEAMRREP